MSKQPLSAIAEINPPLPRHVHDSELVSFVGMSDVKESGGITSLRDVPFEAVKVGFTRFAEGDVLFAKITPCMENGKGALAAGLTNGIGCGSTEFHVLRAKGESCNGFIYQVVQSRAFRQKAEMNMSGSAGQQRVPSGFFKEFPVHIPDPSQQRRIAEILSTLDETIEQTEALVAKMQQVKAGLMHDLFTRGVTPDGRLRPTREQAPELYKESPLGWIPKGWEVERLGDILRKCGGYLQTGPFGSQLHAHEYQVEGVPVVMPQDINDGSIGTEQIARIHERRAEELTRHRMRIGDIVIARRGDLSRAASISEAEQGWVCGTGCFLLRLGQSALRADFAAYVYRQDFVQRQIAGRAVGTTMPSLNNSVMAGLFFPSCDEDEQARIVERLGGVEQSIRTLGTGLHVKRQVKQGLMHDLLTGRFLVLC